MTAPDYLTRARAILAASAAPLRVEPCEGFLRGYASIVAKDGTNLDDAFVPVDHARALTLSRNAIEALLDEHEALAAYVAIGGSGCTGEGAPACEHCRLHDAHERAAAVLREETR